MNDTIANIATSLGVGAISIIRVSGLDAIKLVNKIFKGKDLEKVHSHTIHYGYIVDKEEIIDEVLVTIMRAPKTYTKEDVVEVNCHGGIASTKKVLELLLNNGCRLAEAGEFTKRAFLNGRIDLLEAEAVSDLINSETELERKVAINSLNGNLSTLIKKIRDDLLKIISNIEVNIDYPEYLDIYEVTINDLKEKIPNIEKELKELVENYETSKILYNGITVAIVGRPNVGKSSLLNKLLNYEKAIVTDIPGTTRDIVEGVVYLDGIKLQFIDTAGIRKTSDVVEKIGVEKSLNIIKDANLVLVLLNNNEKLTKEDEDLINKTKDKTKILVVNKNDLSEEINLHNYNFENIVSINTIDDDGIEPLKNKIKELFNFDKIKNSDFTYITNVRHINTIKECLNTIEEIKQELSETVEIDIIEIGLKQIWNNLGIIIGDYYDEELLDNLFKNFCVGK